MEWRHKPSLAERFEERTCPEPNSGCLLWIGRVNHAGYGGIDVTVDGEDRPILAHRVAFFLRHGRWPSRLVLHKCDTPACVNADHLFEGTSKDNAADKVAKGRHHQSKKTHCPKGYPYAGANLWTRPTPTGGVHRHCLTCARAAARASEQRRRHQK